MYICVCGDGTDSLSVLKYWVSGDVYMCVEMVQTVYLSWSTESVVMYIYVWRWYRQFICLEVLSQWWCIYMCVEMVQTVYLSWSTESVVMYICVWRWYRQFICLEVLSQWWCIYIYVCGDGTDSLSVLKYWVSGDVYICVCGDGTNSLSVLKYWVSGVMSISCDVYMCGDGTDSWANKCPVETRW